MNEMQQPPKKSTDTFIPGYPQFCRLSNPTANFVRDNLAMSPNNNEELKPSNVETSPDVSESQKVQEQSKSDVEVRRVNRVTPAEQAEYDNWNPMYTDYHSIQNLLGLDADSPAAFHLGVKQKEYTRIQDTPCRHYQKAKKCPWGKNCQYKHEIVPLTDFGKERVITTLTLDPKPFLARCSTILCRVVHIESPLEFYIVPEISYLCECEKIVDSDSGKCSNFEDLPYSANKDMNHRMWRAGQVETFGEGYTAFINIRNKLTATLRRLAGYKKKQEVSVECSQLVAVRISQNWYRAEVLESDVYGSSFRELPYHKLRLLDSGQTLLSRADNMCSLPLDFCYYPALAYKCALSGIVPIDSSGSSNKLFSTLTHEKILRIDVKDMSRVNYLDFETIEIHPYFVSLSIPGERPKRVKVKGGIPECIPGERCTDVATELVQNGTCLRVNHFPKRPELKNYVGDILKPLDFKNLNKKVNKEEKGRFVNVLQSQIDKGKYGQYEFYSSKLEKIRKFVSENPNRNQGLYC